MKPLPIAVVAAFLCVPELVSAAPFTINVDVTVNESVSNVMVNGIAATPNGGVYRAVGVSLQFGPNTITATATDAAGNPASSSITVLLRTKVNVQGTVDASVVSITVSNGSDAPISVTPTGGTFSALVPISLGVNTITVSAQDAAGNNGSKDTAIFAVRPPVAHP